MCKKISEYIDVYFGRLRMKNNAIRIRKQLLSTIDYIVENREQFVKNPEKDFIRNRKMTLKEIINFILELGGKSIESEILEFFAFNSNAPTSSAVIQARSKLKPEIFQEIFKRTVESKHLKKYKGYQLYAHDGSDLNIPRDSSDETTFTVCGQSSYNLLHINALYDLLNKKFIDVDFQGKNECDERSSLCLMTKKLPRTEKYIMLADRGYESFNVYEHIKNAGHKFVIRTKDVTSKGFLANSPLPETDSFDTDIEIRLTRRQTSESKNDPNCRFLSTTSKFDFLPHDSKGYYPMKLRVVRFKISDDSYESIITNLDRDEFLAEEIKELYHLRWGIETSFRELKYALGLINLHSKKKEFIYQEIYSRLIMYNFSMMISMSVNINKKDTKLSYQINFTRAFGICKEFFKNSNIAIALLIQKYILPIRKNRSDPRKLVSKNFPGFLYRIN